MAGEATELRGAVAEALRAYGAGLLAEPRRFVGAVADVADPESREVGVLYRCCDASWLGPYAEAAAARDAEAAAARYAEGLSAAARRAELVLAQDYAIASDAAHAVAWSISLGTCDALGIPAAATADTTHLSPISDPPPSRISRRVGWRRGGARVGASRTARPAWAAAAAH